MTTLKKLASTVVTPGTPAYPGFPGIPPYPAYTYISGYTITYVGGEFIPMIWDANNVPPQWVQVYFANGTEVRTPIYTTVPAFAGVPPQPSIPATPSVIRTSLMAGWGAGANSIGTLAGNGGVEFTATYVTGALVGLAYSYPMPGFTAIDFGFYLSRGIAWVVELGATSSAGIAYAVGDKFRVVRHGEIVKYFKNGVQVYTSLAHAVAAAPMTAAAALYLASDTVLDARMISANGGESYTSLEPLKTLARSAGYDSSQSVLKALTGTSSGRQGTRTVGVLAPLETTAYTSGYDSSQTKLLPLNSSSTGFTPVGVCNTSLLPLESRAYAGNYADCRAKLLPLDAEATGGIPMPSFSYSMVEMYQLVGAAHGLTGEIGQAAVSLRKMRSISSDHNYVYSEAEMLPLRTVSGKFRPIFGWAQMTLARAFSLDGIATAHPANGTAANLPKPTLAAYGGATGHMTGPSPTLSITATFAVVGRAALSMPKATLQAAGIVGGLATAELHTTGAWAVQGYGGAVASLTLNDGFVITATGRRGGLGRAELTLPLFELTATGTVNGLQGADAVLEALRPGPFGRAQLTLRGFELVAMGSATVTAAHEAYAVNLKAPTPRPGRDPQVDHAVTHFTQYPFDRIVRYGEHYYGVGPTGIYLLEGLTDAGAATAWRMRTALDSMGTLALKRPISVYINARMEEGADVVVVAGEEGENEYLCQMQRGAASQNHRVLVGKGVRSTHYGLELGDPAGGDALINSIDFKVDELKRSV